MPKMVRKNFMLTDKQSALLSELKEATGESESHFVREALKKYAKDAPFVQKRQQNQK
jgi:HPt (histidine-containing phosphotransfer) domain-containing protein